MRATTILGFMWCGVLGAMACGEAKSSSGETSNLPGAAGRATAGEGGVKDGTGGRTVSATSGGGAGTGGTMTGGATTGSGGAPLELPKGCTASSAFSGAGEWSVGITCGGDDYSIACDPLRESGWSCACRNEKSDYTSKTWSYEIETTSAEHAASVTASACASDDPEFADGPEQCQSTNDETASQCAIVESCRRSKELDGLTVVFKVIGNDYSCVRQGTSSNATCDCGDTNWTFPDVDLAEGCGFLREFCNSETRTLTRGDDCSLELEEAWETHCRVNETCDYEVELDDGAAATVSLVGGVSCDGSMTEPPSCYCTDHDGRYLTFEHAELPLTGPKCWEANEVCVHMSEHVREGDFTCEETTRRTVGSSCETLVTCRQPATVGEARIDLLGNLQVHCEQGTDSSWPCTCTSKLGGRTATAGEITVTAGDDASACAAAVEGCLGEVEVVFAGGLPGR